jgi:hypothetical protein
MGNETGGGDDDHARQPTDEEPPVDEPKEPGVELNATPAGSNAKGKGSKCSDKQAKALKALQINGSFAFNKGSTTTAPYVFRGGSASSNSASINKPSNKSQQPVSKTPNKPAAPKSQKKPAVKKAPPKAKKPATPKPKAAPKQVIDLEEEEDYGEYESEMEFENWIGTEEAEKAMTDFEEYTRSLEFKISTGQLDLTTTDYASLTPAQKLLFDQAVEDGLYEVSDSEKENNEADQETEVPEVDDFIEFLNQMQAKETAVDKTEAELMEELRKMGDSFPFVPFLIAQVEAIENDKNLKLFLAAYRIANTDLFNAFTEKQKVFLNDRLMKKLKQGSYIGQSVLIDELPMQILAYNIGEKTVDLVDIITGEIQTLPMDQLFKSTDVFEEGQEYTKLNLDTVVNDQDIAYIKEAYQDIFNNFTASVAEFEKLENADLNSQLLEQLTKCK